MVGTILLLFATGLFQKLGEYTLEMMQTEDWVIVSNALQAAQIPPLDRITQQQFVLRPELEQQLLTPTNEYKVVAGARGSGKTVVVDHAFQNRPGVILIEPPAGTISIFSLLCEELNVHNVKNLAK